MPIESRKVNTVITACLQCILVGLPYQYIAIHQQLKRQSHTYKLFPLALFTESVIDIFVTLQYN